MTVSSQSITVTAAPGAEPSSTERWLRLTTDPPERDEGVSKAQLAGMLDSLIGITDHCKQDSVPTENIDSKIKQKLSGQASCQSSAEQLQLAEKCSPARRTGLPIKKNVYAHWSWNEDPPSELYRVVPLGSAIVLSGPVRSSKVINLVIDVTNSNSAPVRYHADEEARTALWRKQPPRWIGNVVVGKRIVAGPEIGWSNGKVLLGATVSGRLELWLPIKFDTWELSVPGVYIGDGKRSYKAKVFGVSELLAQPAEVNLEDEKDGDPDSEDCSVCGGSADAVPDDQVPGDGSGGVVVNGNPVYCYITINWTLYKSCTSDYVGRGVEYRGVECPAGEDITPTYNVGFNSIKELPDYIYEVASYDVERFTGGGEDVIVAAEYKSKCCYDAVLPGCIPECMTKKSTYYGTTWPLVEQKLKAEYPGETKIVYVGPRSGACGERTDEFVPPQGSCGCPDNSYFAFSGIENYVDIYYNGELVKEFISVNRPDLGIIDTPGPWTYDVSGKQGNFEIIAYNYPKNDQNQESRSRGVIFDFIVSGEVIQHEELWEPDPIFPGGEFYRKSFSCGY
jgi:hypothetical protein